MVNKISGFKNKTYCQDGLDGTGHCHSPNYPSAQSRDLSGSWSIFLNFQVLNLKAVFLH